MARLHAEDLFEVKVEILRQMAHLDPTAEGYWLGRGARALDNPRTSTGEESLKKLYAILDELRSHGRNSGAFLSMIDKTSNFLCSPDTKMTYFSGNLIK